MKTILEYLLSKTKQNIDNSGIKIPENIWYSNIESEKGMQGDYAVGFIHRNIHCKYITYDVLDKLFNGYKEKYFYYIHWYGKSSGYKYENDAICKLFSAGDDAYYSYLDNAELYEEINEDEGIFIARFISDDGRPICVVDTGENQNVYVFVEKK